MSRLTPDDLSNGEKLSLRMSESRLGSHGDVTPKSSFLIKNQVVLKWLTRVAVCLLTLANAGVIAASVVLMGDCR